MDISHLDLSPIPEPIDQLKKLMIKNGVNPPNIILDGKIHRFPTSDKRNDDAGWYVGFDGEYPTALFGDFRTGKEYKFTALIGRELSSDEMEFQRNTIEAAKNQREIERKELHKKSAERAEILFNDAHEATGEHPYLFNKKVNPYGIRVDDTGSLLVPRYNKDGKIISLQFIKPDGSKKFLYGGEIKGGFFQIGQSSEKFFLCEGYSTGATIFEATGNATIICFSANNLPDVARIIRQQNEHAEIIIVCDNDESGTGQKFSKQAADEVGASIIIPPNMGQDVNDYMLAGGDVKKLLIPVKPTYLIDIDDFCNKPSPLKWLIKKWIPEDSFLMMHGASGSGKTFTIIDMCLRMASGLPDWNGFKVNPAPVVYLAGEGHNGLRARIAAWKQEFNPNGKINLWVSKDGKNLDDPIQRQMIIEQIRMLPIKPKLIVVDTLHRFMSGDENSAKESGLFIDACYDLKSQFGCSVLLVHHTGNGDEAQKRARGSSAWRGALDIEISVKAPKKHSTTMTIEQVKNKDCELAPIVYVDQEEIDVDGWLDDDGEQVTSLILRASTEPKKEEEEFDVYEDEKIIERAIHLGGYETDETGRYLIPVKYLPDIMREKGISQAEIRKRLSKTTTVNPLYNLINFGKTTFLNKDFFILTCPVISYRIKILDKMTIGF